MKDVEWMQVHQGKMRILDFLNTVMNFVTPTI